MSTPALHPSAWSLRARLLAALVGLMALVCLVLGVASAVSLRHFLVDRLDTQLTSAGGRSTDAGGPGGPGGDDAQPGPADRHSGARFVLAPGQGAGTVGVRLVGGRVTDAGRVTDSGGYQALPAAMTAPFASLRPGAGPTTLSVPGLGDVRAVAGASPDGDVLVTALPLSSVDQTVYWFIGLESVVSGAALLAAAAAATVIVRRTLQPLHRVATLATQVTSLPLARGEVDLAERVPPADTDPRTEVGRVGGALNQLLDHVGGALSARHASETRVRQFVADASHELRTPLAAIRGYAELTRRSGAVVSPDVAHALDRVESEARRMTVLVEDLLLLARLDEGRPLAREPVDLTRLVVDAVSDASAASPGHSWRLDLPDEPVEVLGDGARLHQVLANLLANARTHTPPGSTVTAQLTSTGGVVALAVVDDGPGIPAELTPHVFERFARGDGSRARQTGSTGLGLAIVAAIVHASGGAVQVESRPGRTAFVVRLPVGAAPAPADPLPVDARA